jgi:hypothetical protein
MRGLVPPPKTTIASALGISPFGRYCHSNDRTNHLEKISLLLSNKTTNASPIRVEAKRFFLNKLISLLELLGLRDRLDRHNKITKAIVINTLDSPSG